MNKIVYTRPDGGVSVEHLAEGVVAEDVMKRLVPEGATDVRVMSEKDIPTDRTFRSAWKPDLTVDMDKAREIHRNRLRMLRAPLLMDLDTEYMRADERSDADEKKRVAAIKQALRDVTSDAAIDKAQTPEELKAAIPEVLKGR